MSRKSELRRLTAELETADSYEVWRQAASQHDELSGALRWRQRDQSSSYDYAQIRLRLDRLRELRVKRDYQGLLFTLNEGIHGNMGGMGRNTLYQRSKIGTKTLIEQYIDEISESLTTLAELDNSVITIEQKLDFFYRANICYGRSALMLSGGGVLGFYHMGVVKALLEQQILPRVISGSSAGSLVAGVIGTHRDDALQQFYDPNLMRSEAEREAGVFARLFGGTGNIEVVELREIIARLIPDLTFQEAYELTGRQISITVAPAEPHQRSRLLNAITSPNIFVRSAVEASCAVPGVFPPVMLMAKNMYGEAQPYLPSRRWVDGSIADDLPAKRLSRLYSTNHFIVSMINPLVTPFLKLRGPENRSRLRKAFGELSIGMSREVLNFYRGIVQKEGDRWPRLNLLVNGVHSLIDQDYSGDVNIVPRFQWRSPSKLLSHLSEQELLDLMKAGEMATYPHVDTIRICTQISRRMELILERFESGDLQPKLVAPRPKSARRRPAPKVVRAA